MKKRCRECGFEREIQQLGNYVVGDFKICPVCQSNDLQEIL